MRRSQPVHAPPPAVSSSRLKASGPPPAFGADAFLPGASDAAHADDVNHDGADDVLYQDDASVSGNGSGSGHGSGMDVKEQTGLLQSFVTRSDVDDDSSDGDRTDGSFSDGLYSNDVGNRPGVEQQDGSGEDGDTVFSAVSSDSGSELEYTGLDGVTDTAASAGRAAADRYTRGDGSSRPRPRRRRSQQSSGRRWGVEPWGGSSSTDTWDVDQMAGSHRRRRQDEALRIQEAFGGGADDGTARYDDEDDEDDAEGSLSMRCVG